MFLLISKEGELLSRVLSPTRQMADDYFKFHWGKYWCNGVCAYYTSIIIETNYEGELE